MTQGIGTRASASRASAQPGHSSGAIVVHRRQPSVVPDRLLRAYLQAEYVVHARAADVHFLIGHRSADLDALLHDAAASRAALITAFNPRSEPRDEDDNRRAHEQLLQALDELGCVALPASGRDPQGAWTPEPSVLALGIEEEAADQLGEQLGQNAYVFVALLEAPRLIVLR